MRRLSISKKMLAVLGAGLLITAASGSAFAMQIREGYDLRTTIEVQQTANERHGQSPALPLPTPTRHPSAEPHNELEFTGPVEVIASDMWVVGERTLIVTADTAIKPGLGIGDQARVHAITQADGTLWAREIEPADDDHDNGNSNDNSNDHDDDHESNVNSNDDNGNDDHDGNVNSNDGHDDDHEGNVNSNDDDHDGNSNGNSNDDHDDDHDGNSNSNEHGHDDHDGSGNRR